MGGKVVTGFRSQYALLTRFNDEMPVAGQTIERVESRGKWLLMHFSGGGILVTHMLMNGSWHIYRPGERWQLAASNMRIVVETADFVAVGFNVPVAEMHTAQSLAREKRIPTAASDVLGGDFDSNGAVERLLAFSDLELGTHCCASAFWPAWAMYSSRKLVFRRAESVSQSIHAYSRPGCRGGCVGAGAACRQRAGRFGQHHRDLSRTEAPHHSAVGSGRKSVGVRPQGKAVPALR